MKRNTHKNFVITGNLDDKIVRGKQIHKYIFDLTKWLTGHKSTHLIDPALSRWCDMGSNGRLRLSLCLIHDVDDDGVMAIMMMMTMRVITMTKIMMYFIFF